VAGSFLLFNDVTRKRRRLDHRWNVDDVQQDMIKAFKAKYDMK
jgi:hypothetical protein